MLDPQQAAAIETARRRNRHQSKGFFAACRGDRHDSGFFV